MQQAGRTFVGAYDKIGVAIARSDRAAFAGKLGKDNRIEGVSSTAGFASRLQEPSGGDAEAAAGPQPGDLPNAPATDGDSLSPFQWDMRQIHTPQAHAITGGSPAVLVGDIDTGLDYRHPDLRANVSDADSADCTSGVAEPGAAAPTTTTATGRTPRARSRRRPTASASSAWRRT